jgi:putative ABC transport system ATP-binding protein
MAKQGKNPHLDTIIRIRNLYKTYYVGESKVEALRGVDLDIKITDFVIIFGPSGCGKSTLLNIIAGIDHPSKGSVKVRDSELFKLSGEDRGIFRAEKFGVVYQMPYWIKSLNVIENIALPLLIEGENKVAALTKARQIMDQVKIRELALHKPTQLSGGQQQKCNMARALVANPWIIVADEPTGNLDSVSGIDIMSMLNQLNTRFKRTIILVTHNESYWNLGTRRIEMKDGQIMKDTRHEQPVSS